MYDLLFITLRNRPLHYNLPFVLKQRVYTS